MAEERLPKKLVRWSMFSSQLMATTAARVVLILLALLVLGWLLYLYVWRPLQKPVTTPGGVSASAPVVDGEVLEHITSARRMRVEHVLRSYQQYERLFDIDPSLLPVLPGSNRSTLQSRPSPSQ